MAPWCGARGDGTSRISCADTDDVAHLGGKEPPLGGSDPPARHLAAPAERWSLSFDVATRAADEAIPAGPADLPPGWSASACAVSMAGW